MYTLCTYTCRHACTKPQCIVFMRINRKIKLAQKICVLGLFIMHLNGACDDHYQKIARKLYFLARAPLE